LIDLAQGPLDIGPVAEDTKARKTERQLMRIVQASVALSVGSMNAFFFSVKEVNPVIRFEFTVATVLGFIASAVLSWFVWQAIVSAGRADKSRFRWLAGFAVALGLGTAAAFACGLRNVSSERYKDFIEGAALAVGVLVALGLVLWRLMRTFERASEPDTPVDDEPDAKK
jgi:hypothetical protein